MKHFPISSKSRLFHFITFILSLYLACIFVGKTLIELCYSNNIVLTGEGEKNFIYLMIFLVSIMIYYFLLIFTYKKATTLFTFSLKKQSIDYKLFFIIFSFTFLFYVVLFGANFPGGISIDNMTQWEQAHSMSFNDHHPAFHTMLLCLFTHIVDSYPFLILLQIITLAFGIAFLSCTLYAWGLSKPLVFLIAFILASGVQTQDLVFYAWKDTTMSLLILLLLSQMINIYLSDGEWFKKSHHWVTFSLLVGSITLVRHNAILFTLPLMILLLLIVI